MKRILIISDTHSHLDEKLMKYIEEADEVWHGGDIGDIELCRKIESIKPLKAVWGNIDGAEFRSEYEEHLVFMCEDVKVYITHIGGYPGKYNPKAKAFIKQENPNLFICGHSHILKVMFDKEFNLLHINPGAAGVHGFHKVKTAIRLQIDGKEMKNLEVIELGPRASVN
ncbi:MAG TPA: metallophosphoesterase family protein [Bacteroidia bacterium]|nr:metallophosphoesterase family protein [Bacteroidia bacterium]